MFNHYLLTDYSFKLASRASSLRFGCRQKP